MLVVETLLAKDKEERPRREPSRDCRKLSEGYMAELGRSLVVAVRKEAKQEKTEMLSPLVSQAQVELR